jgi:hypothetical protein
LLSAGSSGLANRRGCCRRNRGKKKARPMSRADKGLETSFSETKKSALSSRTCSLSTLAAGSIVAERNPEFPRNQ